MEYLAELGVFSGKAFVLAGLTAALLILFFVLIAKARQAKGLLIIEHLNKKFDDMAEALKHEIFDAKALKIDQKDRKARAKAEKKNPPEKHRVYILDFQGDIRASHVDLLREEVSAILTIARPGKDEVVVKLESPGGMAHAYGLAAAQLLRLRDAQIKLTVAIDKVAASGGYMMACTADQILAAPFAIVGSIGVVAQVPNFHRLLKKHDVDFEELTAGEFKRTVSLFGEITEKGRRKFVDQLEDTHKLFKNFVHTCRPKLDLDQVATGEYWYGRNALDLKLVDKIVSSDQYLFEQRSQADLYHIEMTHKKKLSEKFAESFSKSIIRAFEEILARSSSSF